MPNIDDRLDISSSTKYVKKYFIIIVLFIALVIFSVFSVFTFKSAQLIREQMASQAKSLFNGIMVTRLWIASHGGVYVPYVESEAKRSYLKDIYGVSSIVSTVDGQKLLLKTPATAIREISDLANMSGSLKFKITSLSPINPQNAPDDFERKALESFEDKREDVSGFDEINGINYFRYLVPLVVKERCLVCHAQHGYVKGQIRGSLSIGIPADDILRKEYNYKLYTIFSGLGVFLLVCALIHFIFKYFLKDIKGAQEKIISAAITDFLTNTYNRRFGLNQLAKEISRCSRNNSIFSLCLFDIDHFKNVNDTYGHLAGDQVLISFSEILHSLFRDYDIVFRYGGEEFLVVVIGASKEEAFKISERFRKKIEELIIDFGDQKISVTVSAGIAEFQANNSVDDLIARVDCLLYNAKENGRNRVIINGCDN